jgi:hypothetical protein
MTKDSTIIDKSINASERLEKAIISDKRERDSAYFWQSWKSFMSKYGSKPNNAPASGITSQDSIETTI